MKMTLFSRFLYFNDIVVTHITTKKMTSNKFYETCTWGLIEEMLLLFVFEECLFMFFIVYFWKEKIEPK